jgi:hypothetical protein
MGGCVSGGGRRWRGRSYRDFNGHALGVCTAPDPDRGISRDGYQRDFVGLPVNRGKRVGFPVFDVFEDLIQEAGVDQDAVSSLIHGPVTACVFPESDRAVPPAIFNADRLDDPEQIVTIVIEQQVECLLADARAHGPGLMTQDFSAVPHLDRLIRAERKRAGTGLKINQGLLSGTAQGQCPGLRFHQIAGSQFLPDRYIRHQILLLRLQVHLGRWRAQGFLEPQRHLVQPAGLAPCR